ncbi:hypothetical protein K458DRAFT_408640 [Lentithecium fluviatile CBS 122367]|uniref:Uncharacterized protein n=1 Tax=Lentithecium fluviatile CBS 122367 TaxID=1168545 RepID=A0A6G1IKH2_9PLEO|nr:hypothetical protein K458DRAFT_408640 [Lentithecium fluviatile CBS 122367]
MYEHKLESSPVIRTPPMLRKPSPPLYSPLSHPQSPIAPPWSPFTTPSLSPNTIQKTELLESAPTSEEKPDFEYILRLLAADPALIRRKVQVGTVKARMTGTPRTAANQHDAQTKILRLEKSRSIQQPSSHGRILTEVNDMRKARIPTNVYQQLWHKASQSTRKPGKPIQNMSEANSNTNDARRTNESDSEEKEKLEDRIRGALAHTRTHFAAGTHPTAFSNFNVPVKPHSIALTLLRKAAAAGIATFIYSSPTSEYYSLGIPPAPRPFREPDPTWFAGLTRAEMRAGPIREDADVRVAERELRYQAHRREKSLKKGRLYNEEYEVMIGLRRQILGLPMEGEIPEKDVRRAEKERGKQLKLARIDEEMEEQDISDEEDARASLAKFPKRKRSIVEDGKAEDDQNVMTRKKGRTIAAKKLRRAQKQPRKRRARDSDEDWAPGDL